VREALALYGRALNDAVVTSGPASPLVRFEDGALIPLPVVRYVGSADELDLRLLDDVHGPVLDVGCGPGRHLRALSARGVRALGIDLSPTAVALARSDGARAVVADIFGEVPGSGDWRTALLLDGNIGIGGDPVRLLRRLRSLLSSDGVGLIEVEPPGSVRRGGLARLELGSESSGWFPWARVAADDVAAIAAEAGMTVEREWSCAQRWFARLRSPAYV
jgi:SAM-dependent methyltransferase